MVFLWIGRLIVIGMITAAPWIHTQLSEGTWSFTCLSQTAQCWMLAAGIIGLVMWWFSMAFGNRSSQLFPYLTIPVILGLVLVGFQLLPLGTGIAGFAAPQQAELYEKFASPVAGEMLQNSTEEEGSVTPRITMDADGTSRMFNLLVLALICLLLGSHFFSSRKAIFLLPFALTLNGFAISVYGILQMTGDIRSIFGIDAPGQPFGPFVNKNNASGYLLICLAGCLTLAYAAFHSKSANGSRPRKIITREYPIWKRAWLHVGLFFAELTATKIVALIATMTIVTGILFCFSRGGIVALVAGLAVAGAYYSLAHKTSRLIIVMATLGLLVFGPLVWFGSGLTNRVAGELDSLSDTRLLENDARVNHWIQTAPAISDFSPFGSGVGSYLNVHRLYRIDNERRVFYFAENQYFQTLVEAGIPGLLLLLAALLILVLSVRFIARQGKSPRTAALCFMGSFLIPAQLVAAIFDFGMFIPCTTIAFACVCGFIAGQAHTLADRLKKKSTFRFRIPQFLAMAALLATFAVSLFSLFSCYRYASIEQSLDTNPQNENFLSLNLADTDKRIEDLKNRLAVQQDSAGLIRLSELYIYRYRLKLFEEVNGENTVLDTLRPETLEKNWLSTRIDRLHALVYEARRAKNQLRVQTLIGDPLVRENLLPAIYYLQLARQRSPLQPTVHLLLAQLHAISPPRDTDAFHLQRSLELAPANSTTALICGILDLQANRIETACVNLKKCLQIDASKYKQVVRVSVPFLPADKIASDILPDNPHMLFNFAKKYMTSKSAEPSRLKLFERVLDLLNEGQQWDRKSLTVKTEVQERLGDMEGAIKTLQLSIDLNPGSTALQYQLSQLLIRNNQLDEAMAVARSLVQRDRESTRYRRLYERIKKLREKRFERSEN